MTTCTCLCHEKAESSPESSSLGSCHGSQPITGAKESVDQSKRNYTQRGGGVRMRFDNTELSGALTEAVWVQLNIPKY
ncbi:hypothetical protein CesoFtcFv8_018589 [Champsocephalus esox]|uniref:Uncharacterized protein n=1 Tax=Champsocephalus esox TaxID=159716 RepID=A0AAN8BGI4_9TELE|nr:hypothetical protein CesoFtcFv8_018589 [Champsocephalus esox]